MKKFMAIISVLLLIIFVGGCLGPGSDRYDDNTEVVTPSDDNEQNKEDRESVKRCKVELLLKVEKVWRILSKNILEIDSAVMIDIQIKCPHPTSNAIPAGKP